MMKVLIFLAMILTAAKTQAKASISVEPYLGYSKMTYSFDEYADQPFATVLGGKGGITFDKKLFIALDYHLGGPYDIGDQDREFMNSMWGAGAAIIGKKYRLWLGYYHDNTIEDSNLNFAFKGTALKASIGVDFKSKLSVNLEYIKHDIENLNFGGNASQSSPEISVIFLSISAPLYLKK